MFDNKMLCTVECETEVGTVLSNNDGVTLRDIFTNTYQRNRYVEIDRSNREM